MRSILIVEDSVDLRVILTLALQKEGHQVQIATNGKEALDFLENSPPPDLILLDLMMPVMNGWEFLEKKNSDPKIAHIPTVVCSAAKPEKLDCQAFLRKPVDLPDLMETIRNY